MELQFLTMKLLRAWRFSFSLCGRLIEKFTTGTRTMAPGNLFLAALSAPCSCRTVVAWVFWPLLLIPKDRMIVSTSV